MPLGRRSAQRMTSSIWPGFVDAMTALLMVLMFVLSIFMIVQSVLRETITAKDGELDALSRQVAGLAAALGAEQRTSASLRADLGAARDDIAMQTSLIATLTGRLTAREAELDAAGSRIAAFEAQVLALIADRDAARGEASGLRAALAEVEGARDAALDAEAAARLALARARSEIDAATESARLDAARRAAMEALITQLQADGARMAQALEAEKGGRAADAGLAAARIEELTGSLDAAEALRLLEAAAAEALRKRLENADAELTALTLALEERRRDAEETLTLLAAADAARATLEERLARALDAGEVARADAIRANANSDQLRAQLIAALGARADTETARVEALGLAEERARLLALAQRELADREALSAEDQRRIALLNAQVADIGAQLQRLEGLLDAAQARDTAANVQIETLGARLNQALAQALAEQRRAARLEAEVAAEQRRIAELEAAEQRRIAEAEAERRRIAEAEAQQLERYRSDFFGKLRDVLAGVDGVRIVGDRFLFSSEVLFRAGSADLSPAGAGQIANVADTLAVVALQIPREIDWILRVDGHTDQTPLSGTGEFSDNWELSQARALSVVRYLINERGFPPDRLAAAGFGEFQPVAPGRSASALAQNRRIELKLTER